MYEITHFVYNGAYAVIYCNETRVNDKQLFMRVSRDPCENDISASH